MKKYSVNSKTSMLLWSIISNAIVDLSVARIKVHVGNLWCLKGYFQWWHWSWNRATDAQALSEDTSETYQGGKTHKFVLSEINATFWERNFLKRKVQELYRCPWFLTPKDLDMAFLFILFCCWILWWFDCEFFLW